MGRALPPLYDERLISKLPSDVLWRISDWLGYADVYNLRLVSRQRACMWEAIMKKQYGHLHKTVKAIMTIKARGRKMMVYGGVSRYGAVRSELIDNFEGDMYGNGNSLNVRISRVLYLFRVVPSRTLQLILVTCNHLGDLVNDTVRTYIALCVQVQYARMPCGLYEAVAQLTPACTQRMYSKILRENRLSYCK